MIQYLDIHHQCAELTKWQRGCWVRITHTSEAEKYALLEKFGVPDVFFDYLTDIDEQARYDSENGWTLVMMRVPYAKTEQSRTPFITVSFGVIFKDDVLITVSTVNIEMIDNLIAHQRSHALSMTDTTDFIFRLLYACATCYLTYLKSISRKIEAAKRDLDKSIDNSSIIMLSRLQDSLTYFETSIHGDESLLAKLKSKLPIDRLDSDLIEDIEIEMNQARETSQIYSTILDSTMDTYSSVINNNVNQVMRVLTSLSIILMLPTLVASFLGMNLINGMENWRWGFPAIFLFSCLLTLVCWWIFRRKKLI